MSLEVLDPGWASRVVDLGRLHTRSLGVPIGGAADLASLMLGNALLGNPPGAAGLEVAGKGPRLRARKDVGCVLYGAPFTLAGPHPAVRAGVTFTLHAGEELNIGTTPHGMRAYLCVAGGIEAPEILGSRSSLGNLEAGSELPCPPATLRRRSLPALSAFSFSGGPLRVVTGLQADWFDEAEFYRREFAIKPASNRMGLRLEGAALTFPNREMVSEPVCPGAVQVTRDGQCIVLGVDGQTIGGYPKIAQVIAADLDRLAQLRPGDKLSFQRVTLADALTLQRRRKAELHEWITRAQTTAG